MLKLILFGCNGHMGQEVVEIAKKSSNVEIVCGIDTEIREESDFSQFTNVNDFKGKADAIIDFSHHSCVKNILTYAKNNMTPAVICATGHTFEEIRIIEKVAKIVPIFLSSNMSLGVNLITLLSQLSATTLDENYDIEIVEKHHRRKLDAPSGTAKSLADGIKAVRPELHTIYDRSKERSPRGKNEIGIQSIRGGNIVGEHEVMFISDDEVITIKHEAKSRKIFADGAIKAASFIVGKEAKVYTMAEMLNKN